MPPMQDPTDAPPPPSYQMSVEEFDRKTSQAMQLASSTTYAVDEDGWPIYDPAAFEAAGESSEHPPSSSSSAGFPSTETNRHVRQSRPLPLPEKVKQKVKHSSRPTKVRSPYLPFSRPVPLNFLNFRPDRLNEIPRMRMSPAAHHHLHHLQLLVPLWTVHRLKKL
jgi:hypothetical protein